MGRRRLSFNSRIRPTTTAASGVRRCLLGPPKEKTPVRRYKGGLKSKSANDRGNGAENGARSNDGRKRPTKRVSSDGNRRDQSKGDNSISSGLSFLGSTEERRANGNGGRGPRNARPQGKSGGANRNRNHRGSQSGGQPGGGGHKTSSDNQRRRDRA